jgi:hypothetical protein
MQVNPAATAATSLPLARSRQPRAAVVDASMPSPAMDNKDSLGSQDKETVDQRTIGFRV